MPIPVILHAISAAQALPVLAVAAGGRKDPPVPHRRLAMWATVLVLTGLLDVIVAVALGHNRFTSLFVLPIEVALSVWVLEAFHPSTVVRRGYAALAIPIVLISVAVLLFPQPMVAFQLWGAALLALVAVAASLHTLVYLTLHSRVQVFMQDWFWVSLGMTLFWIGFVPVPAFVQVYLADNEAWAKIAIYTRLSMVLVSLVLVSWGVVCPWIIRRYSGRFSQPR